jgi:prevent-host-death family protein
MKKASITQAKNGLSALIDRVRHGDAIVIEDRGVPVARLEPIAAGGERAADGRVARLVRQGALRPASRKAPLALLNRQAPAPNAGARLSSALIADRRSGR